MYDGVKAAGLARVVGRDVEAQGLFILQTYSSEGGRLLSVA